MKEPSVPFLCPVCGRECPGSEASRHHVLPKSRGGRDTVILCRDCHRQIHRLFGVKELARRYPTLDALKVAPQMQKWIAWVCRKPLFPSATPAFPESGAGK